MDFNEELDIDALAELLDGDLESCDSPQADLPLPKAKKDTNVAVNKDSNSSEQKFMGPKYKSFDLFATNSNTASISNVSVESKQPKKNSVVHSGETESSDEEENKAYLTESGKMIKKRLTIKPSYELKGPSKKAKTWDSSNQSKDGPKSKDNYVVDDYSGIRIINPLVPRDMMKSRMTGRRMIKMSFIKNFMKKGDIEGDWVTMGVIVSKVPPKTSKNGKTYSIWKMTDLYDPEKLVSLFLFSSVHSEHWKTSIGTVVGILNPSFLPDREGNKTDVISLSVDHPGKIMLIGTSKDFAFCKGRRKDGGSCTNVVNKSLCEFCPYHVSKEYKKISSKRIELQTSYSGRQPNLKQKVLKGHNFIYGGQMFSPPAENHATKSQRSKDKLTLNNLNLKRKVKEIENEDRDESAKQLTNLYGDTVPRTPFTAPKQFLDQRLSIPSVGARNLSTHLSQMNGTNAVSNGDKKKTVVSITPKELLKLHEQQLKDRLKQQRSISASASLLVENSSPQLGRGYKPGDEISLDIRISDRKRLFRPDLAKFKAIRKLQEKGGVSQKDPNAVKSVKSAEYFDKVKKSVEKDIKQTQGEESPEQEEVKKDLLGDIDLNSEKFQQIMNRKSSHQFEIDIDEMEKQAMYFETLEKKERMELKMAATTEIVCSVVSCRKCRYTAHQATDLCKNENHPLRTHKAVKRFFRCTTCSQRTCAFTKYPVKACRNCGEYAFERTGMMKPRSGPKLDSEMLNIRGDEIKFLNSLKS